MNKRGQGLSLTTIIVAAIGLIVLVVLVAIFTGRIGIFGQQVGQETGSAGQCTAACLSLGHESGSLQNSCGSDEARAPGSYKDSQQRDVNCCCKKKAA